MAVLSEGKYPGDWLKYEALNDYSRDKITILAGSGAARVLTSGMVIAKLNTGAAVAAAVAGNTGNGTMGSVTVGGAKPGVYRLTVIEPGTNAGRFTVEDPDGVNVGVGTVAVAFSGGGLSFTLADGATDFVAGDAFTITVADGFKWVQFSDTATNGAQIAAGLLLFDTTAPDGADIKAVAIVRDAIVSDNGITWPGTADAAEKAAAVLQLKSLGIIVREGA